MKIEFLEEVGSTNDYIKRYAGGGEDVIVCAARQTNGRGTKGRSFLSREGGVYLSMLRFGRGLRAEDAFLVMAHAAVSACKTARLFGASPEIKWPNDVFVCGKKLCGILIENILSGGYVRASVIGIGMNVVNPLDGLEEIAVRLSDAVPVPPSVDAVRDALIQFLREESSLEEYLSFTHIEGKEIAVTENDRTYPATARRVLGDGQLEIETKEGIRALSAAEISVRW